MTTTDWTDITDREELISWFGFAPAPNPGTFFRNATTCEPAVSTAIHEAAHSVAACVLGEPVESVDVERSGQRLGTTYFADGFRSGTLNDLIVVWAGVVAEGMHAGNLDMPEPHGSDEEQILEMCGNDFSAYSRGRSRAMQLCEDHWAAIGRIADALMQNKRLTGAQVMALFCGD